MQTLPYLRTRHSGAPPPGRERRSHAGPSSRPKPGVQDSNALHSSVQVLLFPLPPLLPLLSAMHAQLSWPEQQHAATLLSGLRRQHFIAGRSALRLVLGWLMGCAPRAVPLTCTPLGKPTLSDPAPSLHFSVAHSGHLFGLALTGPAPIGFDLERADPHADVLALAGTAWGRSAEAELATIPAGPRRQHAFFRRWVRFEATHKQTGEGIFRGTRTPADAQSPDGRRNLTYSDLTLPCNEDVYVGAVACPRPLPVEVAWYEPTDVGALLGR